MSAPEAMSVLSMAGYVAFAILGAAIAFAVMLSRR